MKRELDWLLERFEPIGLDEIARTVSSGQPLPKKSFLFLSFDDGFREMAELVAPICQRKRIPAAFFLTTDFLDNRKLGYRHKASVLLEHLGRSGTEKATQIIQSAAQQHGVAFTDDWRTFVLGLRYAQVGVIDTAAKLAGLDFDDYLRTERPYLTCGQVRELMRAGFGIGAHSLDHPRYSEITEDEQVRQTRLSMEFPEKRISTRRETLGSRIILRPKLGNDREEAAALEARKKSASLRRRLRTEESEARLPFVCVSFRLGWRGVGFLRADFFRTADGCDFLHWVPGAKSGMAFGGPFRD